MMSHTQQHHQDSLAALVFYNAKINNRLLSLINNGDESTSEYNYRMAEEGLYCKMNIYSNNFNNIILCYVCGKVYIDKNQNTWNRFCINHLTEKKCWIPKLLAVENILIKQCFQNWPVIWVSPFSVFECGFKYTGKKDICICRNGCGASVSDWPIKISFGSLKALHTTNCAFGLSL